MATKSDECAGHREGPRRTLGCDPRPPRSGRRGLGESQGAVVAYEQEIGRRVPGQRADGTFDVAVSRTVDGDRDDVITRFAFLIDAGTLAGVAIDGEARTSRTKKRSFWRTNLEDGTCFEAAAEPKDADRTLLVLTASKLPSAESLEDWRFDLKELLQQL